MQIDTKIGTEHEYSINDREFNPLPISDEIIQRISGTIEHEVRLGSILISKELQKHAIELIPVKPATISILENVLYKGLTDLYQILNDQFQLLGLGMHPLLKLDQTTFWDHDEQEYYEAYDKLFNIKQHGWLNIQALQINIPYESEDDLVFLYNKIRSLLPYLVAISASSPFVEGKATSYADNRLVYYRENQRLIPLICNDILPEKIRDVQDCVRINRSIYKKIREFGVQNLCKEWVNSRGVIVRFTRRCLEIKAIDEQECIHSDMAISAFILALLRCELNLDDDEDSLRSLMEKAIKYGTAKLQPELENIFRIVSKNMTRDEQEYMPLIKKRIEGGSLAEIMAQRVQEEGTIRPLLIDLDASLRRNKSYLRASF